MTGEVGQVEGEEVIRADELEHAVDALRIQLRERGGEVGFQQDVVGAGGFQLGDLGLLARRGDDGAGVAFGQEDGPDADAAGAAVHEEGGPRAQLRGFEEGAPGCVHAHEDAAKDLPRERGGGDGEAPAPVADGVLGVSAVVGFAAAVDPAGDAVVGFEGGGGAGCFDDADEFFAEDLLEMRLLVGSVGMLGGVSGERW